MVMLWVGLSGLSLLFQGHDVHLSGMVSANWELVESAVVQSAIAGAVGQVAAVSAGAAVLQKKSTKAKPDV